jgi:hypothetical protein
MVMRRFAAEPQLSTAMNAVNDIEANPHHQKQDNV